MKRNSFSAPLVFLTAAMPNVGGHGSGVDDEAIKPVPMSFEEWMQSRWLGDYDQSGDYDFADYAKWFSDNGFDTATWGNFNPGVVNNSESDS